MNEPTFDVWARRLVAPLATAFFVVMFLDWHEASVSVANAVDVQATASGWNGWGAFAGFAAAGVVLLKLMERFGAQITSGSDELVTATFALMTLVFTIVELFTGTANVDVASTVQVMAADRWPAYVALALAALLAFVAVAPLGRPAHGHGGRFGLGTR